MVRKLKLSVWVGDVRCGPDKPVPDDIAAKITNPDVWAEDDNTEPERPLVTDDQSSGAGDGENDGQVGNADGGTVVRPAGNASREAWATYASSRGVDVTGQMGRDEIKVAVEQLDAQQASAQQGQ